MRSQVVPKYYRIAMAEDLRRLLGSIPVKAVAEESGGDHVYLGSGTVTVRGEELRATVRVGIEDGVLRLSVTVPEASVDVNCPFDTGERRAAAAEAVTAAIRLASEIRPVRMYVGS